MKPAWFHPKVKSILRSFPEDVRREIGKLILDLQKGAILSMPVSKPMPSVGPGIEELRIRDSSGAFRVFYFARMADAILILHALQKKSQKTPQKEIDLGRKRLKEMLNETN